MWMDKRLPKSNLCFLIQITIMTSCSTSFHNSTNNESLVNKRTPCAKNNANSSSEDYTFAYSYLSSGAHNFNDSVTIGFLGAYGQAQAVLGALPLAVEAINNSTDILPGRRLSYIAADIGTNPGASGLARRKSSLAARAIRIMTAMRDNGTIAFIGPDDTCSSEALVSAAWNLPMISYKIGINKVATMGRQIATYLNLPNASLYTGHSFRRSSATLLVDAGGDITALKRHGGWKSTSVAEGYVDNSMTNKMNMANKILQSVEQSTTITHNIQHTAQTSTLNEPSFDQNSTPTVLNINNGSNFTITFAKK